MKIFDQHLHSNFSFDSQATMLDECQSAIDKGLAGINFTEHYSVDELDVSYGVLHYDKYSAEIENCRQLFNGKLIIGKGLEIGEPHLTKCASQLKTELSKMKLDIIIGSVHNIGSKKLRLYMEGKSKDELYGNYFHEVLLMADIADIDVLGHMDLAKRYAYDKLGNYDFSLYRDQIAAILKTIIARGIALEVNTSGYRNSVNEPYPSLAVLKLYKSLGGRLITIGSDAHTAKDIAREFDRAKKLLIATGFNSYHHYKARKGESIALGR